MLQNHMNASVADWKLSCLEYYGALNSPQAQWKIIYESMVMLNSELAISTTLTVPKFRSHF